MAKEFYKKIKQKRQWHKLIILPHKGLVCFINIMVRNLETLVLGPLENVIVSTEGEKCQRVPDLAVNLFMIVDSIYPQASRIFL